MLKLKIATSVVLAALFALAGCENADEDPARAAVNVIDRRTDAIAGAYDIESINGTYTGCTNRTGTWSLEVTSGSTLDHAVLSVIKGDVSCALALTEIRTTSLGLLSASMPMSLGTAFGTARSFGSPIKFYANVMVGSVNFASNFSLTLVYSDDLAAVTGINTASFATVNASSAAAQGVNAPNYTLDLTGVTVLTDVSGVTSTVSGNVVLTAGSNTADFYVIVTGSVADTYAATNTAYTAGTKVAISTSIAASSVLATSVNLTGGVVRTLILAKVANGVGSYQKLAITFNPPM